MVCKPPFCWSLATSRNSGSFCSFCDKLRRPQSSSSFGVRIFQAVLVLRAADAVFHRQILHRLHVQRDAVNLASFGCRRRITSAARARCALRAASG